MGLLGSLASCSTPYSTRGSALNTQIPLQHLPHRVADPAGIAPVLNARRQPARQPQTPVRLPQEHQAAIRGNCTNIEVREHLLAGNGWKIEGKKAIVAHGGCRSC
jgi:hypothetical protein